MSKMSKSRTVATLAAGITLLAGAGWFVTTAFPLRAAPQTVADAAGVSVNTQGARLLHRPPVEYPRDAQIAGVEGTVVAQVTLDSTGSVSDASILSGPEQLRKPVLQSLLGWHFTKDSAGGSRQITVGFQLPNPPAGSAPGRVGAINGASADAAVAVAPRIPRKAGPVAPSGDEMVTVQGIEISGLSVPDDEFLSKLPPVHVNEQISRADLAKFFEAVRQVDEHLMVSIASMDRNGVTLRIAAPMTTGRIAASGTPPPPPPPVPGATPPPVPGTIIVGGRVQNAKLTSHENPVYPEIAKSARIQGTVELAVVIAPNGNVQQISVISGHPLLRQAALDAVKTWTYSPTLLNGSPVAVSTTVEVTFTLSQ